jgi:hypothetical protein
MNNTSIIIRILFAVTIFQQMSSGGDVDPGRLSSSKIQSSGDLRSASVKSFEARNYEVTWLAHVTWDNVDTWELCHVSVSFEHVED